jgi:hypothetical protein
MPIFVKDDKSALFVHVPKTGGTSIETLFRRRGYTTLLRTTRRSDPVLFPFLRSSFQHLHAAQLQEMLRTDSVDTVFMLVRHPVARFRSEYAHRNQKDPDLDPARVEQWAEELFSQYAVDPYVRDNHIRPQVEFHIEGCQVYRLEDGIEAAVADLEARFAFGLGDRVPHAMNRVKKSGISSSQVPVSEKLEARIREFYADDYERFGY